MSSVPVRWLSRDPRTSATVEYSPADTAKLEDAFQRGESECVLILGGNKFTVNFGRMQQVNSSGGSRQVMREGPALPIDIPIAAIDVSPAFIDSVMAAVAEHDAAVEDLRKNVHNRSFKMKWNTKKADCVVQALTFAMELFKSDRYRAKYGYNHDADSGTLALAAGRQVPGYFANVVDQSIYHRKMLSLAGLRNMAIYGLEIFEEMRMQRFSSNIAEYKDKTGPHKMKFYSGNVVDLDTVVLNAKAQFRIVNEVLKKEGKPGFRSEQEFQTSPMAKEMIMTQAQMLIKGFIEDMKLSPVEVAARNLNLDINAEIPKASGNTDRGKWPVWHYENVGVSTFHVNVPTMRDVFGALLLAPFHLAKAFVLLHVRHASGTAGEFEEAFDEFFEDGVSDSCFNGKFKSIELYLQKVDNLGSIMDVLNNLQRDHQSIFTPDFFEADKDRTREAAMMWKLAQEKKLKGRDEKGLPRDVTQDDVVAWMKATD